MGCLGCRYVRNWSGDSLRGIIWIDCQHFGRLAEKMECPQSEGWNG